MNRRVVLVTGAGRGIGRAIALALGREGHQVAVTARTASQLEDVVRELHALQAQALAIPVDLTDRAGPARVVEEVTKTFGPVEVLVNNAGLGSSSSPRPLVEFDDDFWDLTLALNVTVPYRLCKLVLPGMLSQHWGRIINIASINAKVPSLHGAAYTASKHALAGLTKVIARESGEFGITANAICPGVTRSEMNDKRLEYDARRTGKSFSQLEAEATPLGRRLEPEEIASLAAFLVRDEARGINGQLLNVCGGTVLG